MHCQLKSVRWQLSCVQKGVYKELYDVGRSGHSACSETWPHLCMIALGVFCEYVFLESCLRL